MHTYQPVSLTSSLPSGISEWESEQSIGIKGGCMGQWLTAVSGFQSQLSHLPTIHFRQVTYPLHALASASIRIPTSKGCCEEKKYMVTQVRHLDRSLHNPERLTTWTPGSVGGRVEAQGWPQETGSKSWVRAQGLFSTHTAVDCSARQ